MATSITTGDRTKIVQLYVSLFGRAPDGEGLGFWAGALAGGKSIATVAQEMFDSSPARAYYPSFLTNQEIVEKFYVNVLGRTADADGLAFWLKAMNATGATKGGVIASMIDAVNNYTGSDPAGVASKALFVNKVAVAEYYGLQNLATGSSTILAGVTSDAASVDAAKAAILNPAVAGQTFTLTTSANDLAGTTGNDTFTASDVAGAATWTAADKLDGGAGSDTFVVSTAGAITVPALATVKNIETASLNSASTVTATTTSWTGLTSLESVSVGGATLKASSTTAVTETDSALAAGSIAINGGSNVTATASGVTTGKVTVGATTAAAGAVTVTYNGSFANSANASLGDTGDDIVVTGGTSVNITETSGASSATKAATNYTVTQGSVLVTGDANTTTVSVTQDAAVSKVDGTTSTGKVGVVAGAVVVTDVNAASATAAGTISSVSLTNFGNSSVDSSALTSVTLGGTGGTFGIGRGALTATPTANTLALNVNTLTGTNTITDSEATSDDGFTTINLTNSGTSVIADLVAADMTTLNIAGSGSLTLTANTLGGSTTTAITNTSTGTVVLGGALATGTTYTGGVGNDSITLGATTKAITLGAGNDTVTLSSGVTALGTGGSIDAGEGTADVLSMVAADVVTASSTGTFENSISGFERLKVAAMAADSSINLANLDDINYVQHAGGSYTMTISNAQNGFTLVQTAASAGDSNDGTTVSFVDSTGSSDSMTVKLSIAADADIGVVTANGIESVSIESDDTATTPDGTIDGTVKLVDDAVKTLTLSGDATLALTNTSTTLTSVDASAMKYGLTWSTVGALAANATILGGSGADIIGTTNNATKSVYMDGGIGSDTLTGGTGNDTITDTSSTSAGVGNSMVGGDGNDTITGGDGKDTINGGAGIDSITAGSGADVITGGGGNDIISAGAGNDTITGASGSENIDAGAGDDLITMAGYWTTGDTIVGGDGNDTLTVTATSDVTAGTTSGVEVVTATFDTDTDTLAMAKVTGLVTLNVGSGTTNNSVATVTGLNSGVTVVNSTVYVDYVSLDTVAAATITLDQQAVANNTATFSDAATVTITNSSSTAGRITGDTILDNVDTTRLNVVTGAAADLTLAAVTYSDKVATVSLSTQASGQDLIVTTMADADSLSTLTLAADGGNITLTSIGTSATASGNAEALANVTMTATNGATIAVTNIYADDSTDGTTADSTAADLAMSLTATATGTSSTVGVGTITNTYGTITGNISGTGTVNSTSLVADDITLTVSAAGTHSAVTATDDIVITATNNGDVTFSSLDSGSTSTGAITVTASGSGILRIADIVATAGTVNVDGSAATGAVRVYEASVTGSTTLTGGSAADSLTGGSGNDLITGNAGNDTLTSGAGADTLAGGEGNDLYVMAGNWTTTDVITDSAGAADKLTATLSSAVTPTALSGIETLELTMNGASVNATNITGTTTLNIKGSGGTAVFTNLAADAVQLNQIDDLGAVSIGYVSGAATTARLDFDDAAAAITNASTTLTNIATLTIDADASYAVDLGSLTASTMTDLTIAGDAYTVDTGAVSAAALVNLTSTNAAAGAVETATITAGSALKTVSFTNTSTGFLTIGNITTGTPVASLTSYSITNSGVNGTANTFGGIDVGTVSTGSIGTYSVSDTNTSTGTSNTYGNIIAGTITTMSISAADAGGTHTWNSLADVGSIGSLSITTSDGIVFTTGATYATSIGDITATFSGTSASANLGTMGISGGTIGNITASGAGDLTITTGASLSVGNVDTSGITAGTSTIVLSNSTLVGTSMTGGAGVDAFTGTGANDTIVAGSGADSITGNGGADTITLSNDSAVDYIFYAAATDGGTGGDSVSNFVVGSDKINIIGDLKTALDSDTSKVSGDVTANTNTGSTYALETTAIGFVNAANNGTLTVADLTASTLTAVAASIDGAFAQADAGADSDLQTEIFLVESDTVGTFGLYAWTQSSASDTTIGASELKLLGVFTTYNATAITATEIAIG